MLRKIIECGNIDLAVVVENGLVPIYEDNSKRWVVNARELHSFLESKQQFADWIKNRIEKYEFVKDVDFTCFRNFIKAGDSNENNKTFKEYLLTVDVAKEISMVEKNERGRQVRRYFIECERRLREQPVRQELTVTLAKELVQKWEQAEKELLEAKQKIQLDAPKVDFFETVAESKTAIDMGTAAKVLHMGIGRNELFVQLRNEEILMSNNQPYQEYIDKGWFRTIEQKYTKPDGEVCISIKTLVYQRGLDGIMKLLLNKGYKPEEDEEGE